MRTADSLRSWKARGTRSHRHRPDTYDGAARRQKGPIRAARRTRPAGCAACQRRSERFCRHSFHTPHRPVLSEARKGESRGALKILLMSATHKILRRCAVFSMGFPSAKSVGHAQTLLRSIRRFADADQRKQRIRRLPESRGRLLPVMRRSIRIGTMALEASERSTSTPT